MTLKEFKIWFLGFREAAGNELTPYQWHVLRDAVDEIEEPELNSKPYTAMPHYVQPCKENNWNTVPLSKTFDPSVVYNNGAVGVSSCGEAYSGIAADILQNGNQS